MTKGGSLQIFHPSPGCGASIGARCRRWCGSLRASCPSTAEWACQGLWRSLGRSLGPNRVADGRSLTVLEWTVVDVDRTWHEDDHKSQRTCTCTAYYFVLESRLWIIMNIIDAHLVQVDAPTLPDLNHTGSSFSAFSVPPSSIRPSTSTSAYHLRHTSRRWAGGSLPQATVQRHPGRGLCQCPLRSPGGTRPRGAEPGAECRVRVVVRVFWVFRTDGS